MFVYEEPIDPRPTYIPQTGGVIVKLSQEWRMKRDSTGYYICHKDDEFWEKIDEQQFLDTLHYMTTLEINEGVEERQLTSTIYLQKRAQIIATLNAKGEEVMTKNVGILSLRNKNDLLGRSHFIRPRQLGAAFFRLFNQPEEFMEPAPFRTMVPMGAGKIIRAGQKMS